MAIYYRPIVINNTPPSSPGLGQIWHKLIGDSYQPFIWLGAWITLPGGGVPADDSNADTLYANVIVQEQRPDGVAQAGWIWVKQSTMSAYLCMLSDRGVPYRDSDYVLMAAA